MGRTGRRAPPARSRCSSPTRSSSKLRILLASRSPQRRAILTQLGMPHRVLPSAHAEETVAGDPVATAERNARGKALEVVRRGVAHPDEVVLGADTVVVLGDEVIGKAEDARQAREYLLRLGGHTHEVVSGLCAVRGNREAQGHAVTAVTFLPLTEAVVDRYLRSGEWRERAGAYAIQGFGSALVQAVDGDYFNVVGLPVALLATLLAELGIAPLSGLV